MAESLNKHFDNKNIKILGCQPDFTGGKKESSLFKVKNFNLYKKNNLFFRICVELFYSVKIAFYLKDKSDFLIYSIPSPLLCFCSYITKKAKYGIDIRDCTWDYFDKSTLYGKLYSRVLIFILKPFIKNAEFITCTNEYEASSILANFNRKSCVIPNGIEQKKFNLITKNIGSIAIQSIKNNILYCGNIGKAQSLETIISVVSDLKNCNLKIIGQGAEKKYLENYCSKNYIKNVDFYEAIKWKELLKEYSNAKVLYAQITKEYSSAIPSKIFEYIATGRQVVLGLPDGVARSIFSEFSGVYIHKPNDIIDCRKALIAAFDDKPVSRKNNEEILKNYIRESHAETFLSQIPKRFKT